MSVYTKCDPDGPAYRDCPCPRCRQLFKGIVTKVEDLNQMPPLSQPRPIVFTEDHIGILRDVITMFGRDEVVAITVML